jgi:hypothetical protein
VGEAHFWEEFLQKSDLWSRQIREGSQRSVFDAIDKLLEFHGLPFCFDISSDDTVSLLIFSPEGDVDDAAMIDKLVAAAPRIRSWSILRRRPKKRLADAATIVRNLYLQDPMQAKYRAYDVGDNHIVEMVVPTSSDVTPEEGQGMINTFLWHAFGEESVMDHKIIGKIHFDDTPSDSTVSVVELVEIVQKWVS